MNEEKMIITLLKELGCAGILITDGDGRVTSIDENFFRDTWGLQEREIIGKSVFDLEKAGTIKPALAIRVIAEQKPVTLISEVRGLYNVVGEAFPIFDEGQRIKWIVSFTRNIISERKVLQMYDEMLEAYRTSEGAPGDAAKNRDGWNALDGMATLNERLAKTLKQIERIAPYDVTVLLTGATGTGKSMLAKKIHRLSGFCGEFVELNCGAITENLIESELFGYEDGAFTGAAKGGKRGLVEAAENGTLFLDEISEMPVYSQVKLLQFLQEKKIRRVGGTKAIEVNCRVVAATNKNLQNEVREGRFREDLFYRLNLAAFQLPSLEDRYEDIIPLAKSILNAFNEKYHSEYVLDYEVLSAFMKYSWPGNVRELENTIQRMALMSDQNVLHKDLLPKEILSQGGKVEKLAEYMETRPGYLEEGATLKTIMEDVERSVITDAWRKYQSSTKVAVALDIGQTTAARKIKKYVHQGRDV